MADFCEACSIDMRFPENDLHGITSEEDWAEGMACSVICEGCGIIQVDPAGNCVSKNCLKEGQPGHGLPWISQEYTSVIIKVHKQMIHDETALQVRCTECERQILITEDQDFCPICFKEIEQLNIKAWEEYKQYEIAKCTNITQL